MPIIRYAEHSARCAEVKPNRLLHSSRDAGWTSLLLDQHEGVGTSEPFETHPTSDLTLVVATAGHHRIDVLKNAHWRSAIYRPGAAGLTPALETTRMRWASVQPSEPFRTAHLYLPSALIESIADEYRRAGARLHDHPLDALIFDDPAIAACVSALARAMMAGESDLYAEQASRWLAAHLLSSHAGWWDRAADRRDPGTIADRRLAGVLEYMSAHLGTQLSVTALAREAGISVHHFGRRFRAQTGRTPAAYLTDLRMDLARRLLMTTDVAIAEIALSCGYTRPTAFATAFTRHFGLAPSGFRSNARKGSRSR